MKVSSPIGDLPFEIDRLRFADGALVIDGAMGAWPARVQIYPRDIFRLLRLPLAAALIVVAIIALAWIV